MPEAYKRLAAVTIGASKATAYTVPAATTVIVKNMRIVNIYVASVPITLWHNSGSTEVMILYSAPIDLGGFAEWDGTLCLATGDTISVDSNVAAAAEFSMYGIEIT